MGRAIEAARRAFDDTDWSTNTELRVRCIRQLQQALRDNIEELREHHHRRGGRTADADADGAARRSGRGPQLLRRHRRVLPVDNRSRHRLADGHQDPPHDRPGSGRRGRGDHPVELPAPDQPRQARARRWPRATPSSSSRRPTPRGAPRSSASSSPSTPTSRRASSTSSRPATTASARCCRKTHGWTWFRSPGRRTPAVR